MIKRGEIYLADLDPAKGSEIKKTRPVIVVSNDISNLHSATVTIVPLTTQKWGKVYPFEVLIDSVKGLSKTSKAKANQVRTIHKRRFIKKIASLSPKNILELNQALRIHLSL